MYIETFPLTSCNSSLPLNKRIYSFRVQAIQSKESVASHAKLNSPIQQFAIYVRQNLFDLHLTCTPFSVHTLAKADTAVQRHSQSPPSSHLETRKKNNPSTTVTA